MLGTSFCPCLTTYLCLFLVRFAIFYFSDTSWEKTEKTKDDDANDLPKTSGNSGTIIVDATCVPSNIRFP